MAISTPGDIVLDVVRAASPAAVETARARLASFSTQPSGEVFAAPTALRAEPSAAPRGDAGDAFQKFEAMVLQTFIQSMLPKDTQSVYGEGMAGDMWQSLLAQQLGTALAARGGIGIADRVLGEHYARNGEAAKLDAAPNDRAERDLQEMLSVALVQEIQRKTTRTMEEEAALSSITSQQQ